MKIRFHISTGYVGASREDIFEMPDDSTEEDITAEAFEVAMSLIDWGYQILDEEGNKNEQN